MTSAAAINPDLMCVGADPFRALILILSHRQQLNAEAFEMELFVAKLKREQFGNKSDKLDSHLPQLELELEFSRPPRSRNQRAVAGGLPRLRRLSQAHVTEFRDYVPARFKVFLQVCQKLDCTGCDCIVQGPAPVGAYSSREICGSFSATNAATAMTSRN